MQKGVRLLILCVQYNLHLAWRQTEKRKLEDGRSGVRCGACAQSAPVTADYSVLTKRLPIAAREKECYDKLLVMRHGGKDKDTGFSIKAT